MKTKLAGVIAIGVLVLGGLAGRAWGRERGRLEGVVNINTATTDELELLPGVGPAKARRIVAYREQQAFRTVEELARVKGIGPKTVRRLRPHLVVRGPTTAHEARAREPDGVSGAGQPIRARERRGRDRARGGRAGMAAAPWSRRRRGWQASGGRRRRA